MKARIMLAGLAAVTMTAVGTTSASAKPAVDTGPKTVAKDCIDQTTGQKQGTFVWEGPTASWPPNHKDKTATITLTDYDSPVDDPADDVMLLVTAGHDEILADGTELNGTGNTNPLTDATGGTQTGAGSATVPVRWRSERSGRGDGRTYTFDASGTTDGAGANLLSLSNCRPVQFTVSVPHDLGGGNDGRTAKRKLSLRKRSARR